VKLEPPNPPLADDRILLRVPHADDVPVVAAACRDVEIARWITSIPLDYTEEHAARWVASTQDEWAAGSASFVVAERASSAFVGVIGLVVKEPWLGEIGYWTVATLRGLGYATRALRLMTRWGHRLGLIRLQLAIMVGNASERVAEKAGYRLEGTLRAYAEQRGELRDMTLWARLADDPSE
jgi:RimJ/RimL family protein N-acetyltransferase